MKNNPQKTAFLFFLKKNAKQLLFNLYYYYICLYKRNRHNYKNGQRDTHITTPAFAPHFAKTS